MKYVMLELKSFAERLPIVFPDHVNHADVVRGYRAIYAGYEAVSAGFCNASGNVWGGSITLGLTSKEADMWELRRLFQVEG